LKQTDDRLDLTAVQTVVASRICVICNCSSLARLDERVASIVLSSDRLLALLLARFEFADPAAHLRRAAGQGGIKRARCFLSKLGR